MLRFFFCQALALLLIIPNVSAGPGGATGGPASPTPTISGTGADKELVGSGKGSTMGIQSTKGTSSAPGTSNANNGGKETMGGVTAVSDTTYTTDAETESLQSAIDRFNKYRCPPETPIMEITTKNLERLVRNEFIKRTDINKYEGLVMRNGRVFRKTKKPVTPVPGEVGEVPDSLLGTVGAAVDGLSQDSPKGDGNKPGPAAAKVEEKRVTVRGANGEIVDFKYFVPKTPGDKQPVVQGKKVKETSDMIRKTQLPPKFVTKAKAVISSVSDAVKRTASDIGTSGVASGTAGSGQ